MIRPDRVNVDAILTPEVFPLSLSSNPASNFNDLVAANRPSGEGVFLGPSGSTAAAVRQVSYARNFSRDAASPDIVIPGGRPFALFGVPFSCPALADGKAVIVKYGFSLSFRNEGLAPHISALLTQSPSVRTAVGLYGRTSHSSTPLIVDSRTETSSALEIVTCSGKGSVLLQSRPGESHEPWQPCFELLPAGTANHTIGSIEIAWHIWCWESDVESHDPPR